MPISKSGFASFTTTFTTRLLSGLAVCAVLGFSVAAIAQEDTTATVDAAEASTASDSLAPLAVMTPKPESETANEDSGPTQTVVLMGEKVSVENPDSPKGPFPDLVALTTSTIGGRVVDLTTPGLTMEATAAMVGKAVIQKPDVVVLFTGFTDEKQSTEDEAQRAALKKAVQGLEKTGARVFLVPASSTVGAMTSANLRLVASELGVDFVAIGTEVGGQPFIDAFEGVQQALAEPESEPVPVAAPAPSTAVTVQGRKIAEPGTTTTSETPDVNYEESKAQIQKELERIAGESDDSPIFPDMGATTTSQEAAAADTKGTTIPEGGVLTKRGKEAQENINMRPLPAVKAFRPQIPVPRNQIDEKEPGLSR